MKVHAELTEEEKGLQPREFVEKAIDPELDDYVRWLSTRDKKGALAPFERDLLRSFLWWKSGR